MAEANRYYWLKLKEDFFYKSKRMKKLRRMAGGDTYLIIYLKIQLLAMKTDGILKWTGLEEDFANELALAIDENPDNIKVVLAFLLQYGLAESSDNINFFFPYSVENSGSESSSAQRMRESRASMKALPSQSVHNVQQSDTEIEIEKEEKIDKRDKSEEIEVLGAVPDGTARCTAADIQNVIDAWNSLGLSRIKKIVPGTDRDSWLRKRIKDYGIDEVLRAIENIRRSDFLQGKNKNGWEATFDWFIRPNNFPKVLDGNYENRSSGQTSNPFLEMLRDEL